MVQVEGTPLPREDALLQALAQENLGIYNPPNLLSALQAVGEANQVNSWKLSNLSSLQAAQTTAYFLGQEVACHVWQSSPNRNPAMPFVGVEKLSLPTSTPQVILLVGCASAESYRLEQAMLQRKGIDIKEHTTIDVSPLPLRRINKIIAGTSFTPNSKQQLMIADARDMPFPEMSYDMILTDLMLGSTDPQTEKKILNEIARVTRKGGNFIMRASILTDEQSQKLGELMDYIGAFWNMWANKNYGRDEMTGRDKYLLLLPDQWKELGSYYSAFIKQNYFGRFRFRSLGEVQNLIENTGTFRVEEIIAEPIQRLDSSSNYYAIKAKKIA